ncbi:hypothetical protein BH10ACT1_BH10ACT1_18100 [soil metagenome]
MAATSRRPALVVSHERSGTHFLMNTLRLNFGYQPRTDLEQRPGFDPGSTPQMLAFLLQPWPLTSVVKSHHQAAFFPVLPRLAERFHLVYVVRDPRDALLSFWRYLAASPPGIGPRAATAGGFARVAPCGFVAGYQRTALRSMTERWRVHADGWLEALERLGDAATLVRYEDLDRRYPDEVERLAAVLDVTPPAEVRRPSLHEWVIHPGEGGSGKFRSAFGEADLEFVHREAGETMLRLGYSLD